uniref:Uncharacterized protein n=1 Tax=Rhodnius prolixus TaxID=13249 RepID=T1HLG8_RHOPR
MVASNGKLLRQFTLQVCGKPTMKILNKIGINKSIFMAQRTFTNCTRVNSGHVLLKKPKKICNTGDRLLEYPAIRLITISSKLSAETEGSSLTGEDCDKNGNTDACHKKRPPKKVCRLLEVPKVTGDCLQVCSPCCKPSAPLDNCRTMMVTSNFCKGKKYKYPAYAESLHTIPIEKEWLSDCCYWKKCCPRTELNLVPEVLTTYEKQRDILGFIRKSKQQQIIKRKFSTFTSTLFNKKDNDCKKGGGLPCLKRDPNALRRIVKSRKTCDKLCMPCCKPARDPPECYFPYVKPKCEKKKPPRPSFSECQAILKSKSPCECIIPPAKCDTTGGEDKVGCHKK